MFFWKRAKGKQPKTKGLDRLSTSLENNLHWFKSDILIHDETIIYRHFRTQEPYSRECVLIYADNMANSEFLSQYALRPLMTRSLPKGILGRALVDFIIERIIQSDQVDFFPTFGQLIDAIARGSAVLLVEGGAFGITIEAPGWDRRNITEPQSESVVRGPRQGFTEDLGVNINLVRRKIAGPQFKVKYVQVGRQTKTKIAVVYVETVASTALVEEVVGRIEKIEIDAILESGYIQELIQDGPNFSLPTIGHTERPDVVAAKILEGRVAVLVDGTPFALTMPYLFVEVFQANEDYYNHWLAATFHRILRYISFFITTSTPALYLALISYHPQLIPTPLTLSIAAARKKVPFPGFVEVILMGLVFEILREGGVRLPRPVGQAISIVGAIVLGDAAVNASLVGAPMIVVVGLTAIAGFVVSSIYDSTVIMRLFLVLTASVLGIHGYFLGLMAIVLQLSAMESFGVPYLSSLIAFTGQDIKDTAIRAPWRKMVLRPRYLGAKNRERLQTRSRGRRS